MSKRLPIVLCALLSVGCERNDEKRVSSPRAPAPSPAGEAPQLRAGSASYWLDLGSVYERYRDGVRAREAFQRALDAAETAAQKQQAHMGLGRLRETAGDLKGAIEAFESAMVEADRGKTQSPASGPMGAYPGLASGEDLIRRLGHLYEGAQRFDDAERLYEKALAELKDPYQRDNLLRLEIALWGRAGTLERHLHEKEAALTDDKPDESALHLLALAYAGGQSPVGLVPPGWALGGAEGEKLERLVRVYDRLYKLHPEDSQLRQALLNLYERGGRVDETIALLRASSQAQPFPIGLASRIPSNTCPTGSIIPRPLGPTVAAEAEIVRVLLRAKRDKEALAETAKLIALGSVKTIGARAYLAGARLYLEMKRPDLAERALATATKTFKEREDQRELAAERMEYFSRTGNQEEIDKLLRDWERSDDPCLIGEAERREQILAQSPGPPKTRAMP